MLNTLFDLQVEGPGFSGRTLSGDLVTKFLYEERMDGCATWGLQLATDQPNAFQDAVKDDKTPLRVSFGSIEAPQHTRSVQKSLRIIDYARTTVGTNRDVLTFRGLCNGVSLLQHRAKDKVWKDQKISDIVSDLVRSAGLQADVAETEGKFTISGRNENTCRLIKDELLPLAYKKLGDDWQFWIKDGQRVVFSPPRLDRFEYKFTNSSRPGWVTMIRPVCTKDLSTLLVDRAGKIEVQAFDIKTNRLYRKEVGEDEAQFDYAGSGAPKAKTQVAETRLISKVKDRNTDVSTQKLVERVANNIWSRNARTLYAIVSEVEFTPGLTINRMCDVDIRSRSADNTLFNGSWLTWLVRHSVVNGKCRSWVVLVKRWE